MRWYLPHPDIPETTRKRHRLDLLDQQQLIPIQGRQLDGFAGLLGQFLHVRQTHGTKIDLVLKTVA